MSSAEWATGIRISPAQRIECRVGIKLGDLVVEGDDVLGDRVNAAVRPQGITEPGGICILEAAHSQSATRLIVPLHVNIKDATMAKKPKFTAAQVKRHIENIQEELKKQQRESEQRKEQFTSITPEQILKKLKRVNSPMIIGQGWNVTTPPGGTINYTVTIYNPDPVPAAFLFVHAWIGSGNIDPNIGTFLLNADSHFAQLKQPADVFGGDLPPSSSGSFAFAFRVTTSVQPGNYFLQSCLMQVDLFDVGTYLDRAMVVFTVT